MFLLDELLLAVELVCQSEEDGLHMVGHGVVLGTSLKQRHPSESINQSILVNIIATGTAKPT